MAQVCCISLDSVRIFEWVTQMADGDTEELDKAEVEAAAAAAVSQHTIGHPILSDAGRCLITC